MVDDVVTSYQNDSCSDNESLRPEDETGSVTLINDDAVTMVDDDLANETGSVTPINVDKGIHKKKKKRLDPCLPIGLLIANGLSRSRRIVKKPNKFSPSVIKKKAADQKMIEKYTFSWNSIEYDTSGKPVPRPNEDR